MVMMAIRHMLWKLDGSERQLKTVMKSMRALEKDHAKLVEKYNDIVKIVGGQQTIKSLADVEELLRRVLPAGVSIRAMKDGPFLVLRLGPTHIN